MRCPRCTGPLSTVFIVVSRTDWSTRICTACRATETALVARGEPLPYPREWPVRTPYVESVMAAMNVDED